VSDAHTPDAPTPTGPAAEAGSEPLAPPPAEGEFLGTGRRKSAVARVRLRPGKGDIRINKREVENYFSEPQARNAVLAPLVATNTRRRFDVDIRVHGGGITGQAGAILLGVARAIVRANAEYEPILREREYLTRDARRVERKKYGRRKARRRFQFSKR
jgi:small subunit ribosomal protein S9